MLFILIHTASMCAYITLHVCVPAYMFVCTDVCVHSSLPVCLFTQSSPSMYVYVFVWCGHTCTYDIHISVHVGPSMDAEDREGWPVVCRVRLEIELGLTRHVWNGGQGAEALGGCSAQEKEQRRYAA